MLLIHYYSIKRIFKLNGINMKKKSWIHVYRIAAKNENEEKKDGEEGEEGDENPPALGGGTSGTQHDPGEAGAVKFILASAAINPSSPNKELNRRGSLSEAPSFSLSFSLASDKGVGCRSDNKTRR